jgi:hypothetical protein
MPIAAFAGRNRVPGVNSAAAPASARSKPLPAAPWAAKLQQPLGNQAMLRRLHSAPGLAPPDAPAQLQSALGNQAILRILGRQQPRVAIDPSPQLEQQADRIADAVTRTSEPSPARRPPALRFNRPDPGVPVGLPGPPVVHNALRFPGQPLDRAIRADMESRFNHDFSDVRVHTNADAMESARALQARAYTVGNHLVFARGQYSPTTTEGRMTLAHELAHVIQQRGSAHVIQRQPAPKSKFDFMTADVEGEGTRVMSIYRPSDPAEFLDAFEEKGKDLINAEYGWLSNNLIQYTGDVVLKQKRDPYANIDVETLREVVGKGYEKAIGALAVKGAEMGAKALLKVIYVGKKVLWVGKKAGRFGGIVGTILMWLGASLVQAFLGRLFDRTKELIKQAVHQFEELAKKLNEDLIPKVTDSAIEFSKFMMNLRAYLLQDPDKPVKKGSPKFSVGQGDYKMDIEIDTSIPLTDMRLDHSLQELGNVVLAIDAVLPVLAKDVSLYSDLAQRTGVYSERQAQATSQPAPASTRKPLQTYDSNFKGKYLIPGQTKFDVPDQGSVVVTSEAHITDATVDEKSDQAEYYIDLYRVSTSWFKGDRGVDPTQVYHVNKSETSGWYKLDDGQYYLVIHKADPVSTIEGNVHIEVNRP